jgi:hypothetical protein
VSHPEVPRVEFNGNGLSMNIEEAVTEFRRLLLAYKGQAKGLDVGESVGMAVKFRVYPCDCDSALSGRDEYCPLHGDSADEGAYGLPEWCCGGCRDARCHRCYPRANCTKHPKCVVFAKSLPSLV